MRRFLRPLLLRSFNSVLDSIIEMAEIYVIVRIATMILCGVVFVSAVLGLVDVISSNYQHRTQAMVSHIIVLAVMLLGAYGSWKNNRIFLYVFALILLIATIVGATGVTYYASVAFNVILVIMAAAQAELLRQGYA